MSTGTPFTKTSRRLIGAAVGSGMTAQAAELGKVDFLMVLNAGYFRAQGCGSAAALMPYQNANSLAWQVCLRHVMPRLGSGTPVYLGLCAQDPELVPHEVCERVRAEGLWGITNFPSVGFVDGQYREALEESGLGFDLEVELIRQARQQQLGTIGFVFSAAEASAMAAAGAEALCLDLGFAHSRPVSDRQHQDSLDEAFVRVNHILKELGPASKRPPVMVLGGPLLSPRDAEQLFRHTSADGYIGGSAIERFPASPLITQTVREFGRVASPEAQSARLGALWGQSEAMRAVIQQIEWVAETDVPVLLVGESGTGKELAARELHRLSRRCEKPMVCWNCAALSEELAMSELFGHERGAFTGAHRQHQGRFEQASGGTLFMDEVTELSLPVQASLLRVLQEREIVRVGGSQNLPVDVRLVAATNRQLPELIRTGHFRLDLYYRLNTMVIRMPPLRERQDDIPYLAREMVQEFCRQYDYPVPGIPARVLDRFQNHTWPGNIRELRNAIERCVIMGRGETFETHWLDDFYQTAALIHDPGSLSSTSRETDRQHARGRLAEALARHGGNKTAAARELGITRKTLYAWIREDTLTE